MLNAADLGTGVDTIRPVKKVDPQGSLRLSSEFVGNMRKEGTASRPSNVHRRSTSEVVKAGRSLIDEVVLPILTNVSSLYCLFQIVLTDSDSPSKFMTKWMREKSNR